MIFHSTEVVRALHRLACPATRSQAIQHKKGTTYYSLWDVYLAGGSSASMSTSELSADGFPPEFWSSDTFSSAPEPPKDASLSSIASSSPLCTDSSAMFTGWVAL